MGLSAQLQAKERSRFGWTNRPTPTIEEWGEATELKAERQRFFADSSSSLLRASGRASDHDPTLAEAFKTFTAVVVRARE